MPLRSHLVWLLFGWQLQVTASHRETSSATTTSYPNPYDDGFYQVPKNIASASPGQVLRTRQIITAVTGQASRNSQMFFATTDAQGKASGTVGTVWEPALPASPPKIFSYQFAEDSVNLECAASWAWVNESSPEASAGLSEASLLIPWALARGYYVVNVDNEGPKSAWLTGKIEGQSVLDGIRATINHLRLPPHSTESVLYGYSGAAHASAWASTLSAAYAPQLTIAGAAFGGTPVDLVANIQSLNEGPAAVLAGLAFLGLGNGYPALNDTLNNSLTMNGTQTAQTLRAPGFCAVTNILEFSGVDFTAMFKGDIFSNSVVQRVFAENSLLSNESVKPVPAPQFPRFQFHGRADTIVLFDPAKQFVNEQCAGGADICFVTFPGLGHSQTSLAGLPGALHFLEQALEKKVSTVKCGTNVTVPAIGSAEAVELLGPTNNIALAAELSQATL